MQLTPRVRTVLRFVPLLVSVAACAYMLRRFEGYELLGRLDPMLLAVAVLWSITANLSFGAVKWWRVARLMDIDVGFVETFRLWVGLFPAVFLTPVQAGNLLYVAALRNKKNLSTFHALECVAYDKVTSLVGAVAWLAVGQLILPREHALRHPLILVGGALLVAAFLAERPLLKLMAKISFLKERSRLMQHPVALRHKPGLLVLALLQQSTDVTTFVLMLMAMGIDVDLRFVVGAYPVVLLIAELPISFSGFGVREQLIALTFGAMLSYDQAIAAGLMVDGIEYILPALVGLPALPHVLRVMAAGKEKVTAEILSEPPPHSSSNSET